MMLMTEARPTIAGDVQQPDVQLERRCDNMVWNRERKEAVRCDRIIMTGYLAPGSSIEVMCKKCGKRHPLKG